MSIISFFCGKNCSKLLPYLCYLLLFRPALYLISSQNTNPNIDFSSTDKFVIPSEFTTGVRLELRGLWSGNKFQDLEGMPDFGNIYEYERGRVW